MHLNLSICWWARHRVASHRVHNIQLYMHVAPSSREPKMTQKQLYIQNDTIWQCSLSLYWRGYFSQLKYFDLIFLYGKMILPKTVTFVKSLDSAKHAFLWVQIRILLAFLGKLPSLYKEVSGVLLGVETSVDSFSVGFRGELSLANHSYFSVCSNLLPSAEQNLEKKLCPIVLLYVYISASTGN